jgi:hypothetical protein
VTRVLLALPHEDHRAARAVAQHEPLPCGENYSDSVEGEGKIRAGWTGGPWQQGVQLPVTFVSEPITYSPLGTPRGRSSVLSFQAGAHIGSPQRNSFVGSCIPRSTTPPSPTSTGKLVACALCPGQLRRRSDGVSRSSCRRSGPSQFAPAVLEALLLLT